ncbi:hypothetical protein IEQ34_012439 [Dendrobium chrysotoxum]|uniref:Pentatricopeptide repeat-containing protein n=1 Tax=Dendrobium chrysotoxum TaxID=161865 RepID=A0AAV7GU69_DENCH|nr:hypothetical protein IEQ34_012439 [Dendrobium chrysotoxum]
MASILPVAMPPLSSSIPDRTNSSQSSQLRQVLNPYDSLHHYLHKATDGNLPGKPDFITAMKACTSISNIPLGRTIHAHITKSGLGTDKFVATSIISFYSVCGLLISARQLFDGIPYKDVVLRTSMLVGYAENGNITDARKLFDDFPDRDLVAWNAMLSCYLRCGFPEETLALFQEMQIGKVSPNEVTLIIALSACSQIGCLALGEWIHAFIHKFFRTHISTKLINAMVHMYAKCGRIDIALEIFISQENKNLESWNTLLTGFAVHGFAESSFSLFSQMIRNGVLPDRITLLALLISCNHAGMVIDAIRCFMLFTEVYGVRSGTEHYGCLVDALCRNGHLEEASMLIEAMPFESNACVWGALLRGCMTYQNHELGLEAAKRLLELEPCEEGRYIALSNLISMIGEVEDVMRIRKMMIDLGIRQLSGMSSIEAGGEVHKFLSGDRSHIQSMDIYATIASIHSNMG